MTTHIEDTVEATLADVREIMALLRKANNPSPIVDGSMLAPSTRALPRAEEVYQSGTLEDWHCYDELVNEGLEAMDLTWHEGMLFHADDVPEA